MKSKYFMLGIHIVCCVLNFLFIFNGTSTTQIVCSSVGSLCWAGCAALDAISIWRETKKQNDTEAEV